MATYSRVELAKLCGITQSYVTVYIKRKQVVLNADGKIDDSDPVNYLFIQQRVISPEAVQSVKKKVAEKVEAGKRERESEVEASKGMTKVSLTEIKMRKELGIIAKNEKDLEIKEFELQKKRAELIPVKDAQDLVIALVDGLKRSFYYGAESYSIRLKESAGVSPEAAAEMRGYLVKVINKAVEDGARDAQRTIREAAEIVSEKREAGD